MLQVMFLAMSFALPIHFLCRLFFGRSPGEDMETVIVNGKPVQRAYETSNKVKPVTHVTTHLTQISLQVYWMVILPAIFDLIGTALAKVGLMYTSVSVYQLIRSSVIVFCAIFNIFLLKKTIRAYMWLGIFAITGDICLPFPANNVILTFDFVSGSFDDPYQCQLHPGK